MEDIDNFKIVRKKRQVKLNLETEMKKTEEAKSEEIQKEPVKLKKEDSITETEFIKENKEIEYGHKEIQIKEDNSVTTVLGCGYLIFQGIGILICIFLVVMFIKDVVPQIIDNSKKTKINYSVEQNKGVDLYNQGIQYAKDKEYEKAFEAYKKAAVDYDIAEAMLNLGYCYSNGKGCTKDEETGFYWTKKAAEKGIAMAQCNLGVDYENGLGCSKNEEEAFKWYQKSASQVYITAIVQLGLCYRDGIGVEPDQKEAFKLFKQVAEKEHLEEPERDNETQALAKRLYAMMYYEGKGCEKNLGKAKSWMKKSAEQGDETAKKALKLLFEENNENTYYEDTNSYIPVQIDNPIALGGINIDDDVEKVIQIYGQPDEISDTGGAYFKYYCYRRNELMFQIMDNKNIVLSMEVHCPGIKTLHGIQVGDSEFKLLQVYGDDLKQEDPSYLYTLSEKNVRGYPKYLRFVINNGKVSTIWLNQDMP